VILSGQMLAKSAHVDGAVLFFVTKFTYLARFYHSLNIVYFLIGCEEM
jgi:hypothetical protein